MRPTLKRFPTDEKKATASFFLPDTLLREIEDIAYARRTNKSHEVERLITIGLQYEQTPQDESPKPAEVAP